MGSELRVRPIIWSYLLGTTREPVTETSELLALHLRGPRGVLAAIAIGAVTASMLGACTSKSTHSAAPSAPAPASSAAATAAVSASQPPSASTNSAPIDGRADPGAYAGALDWTDITKQVDAALGGGQQSLSYARAEMQVPLNWADANGKKISITVLRIRSKTQHDRLGSLVINPGGPGASGVEAAIDLTAAGSSEQLPAAILDRFDIVGFDPRGIGLSHPLQCITDKQKDAELNLPADPQTDAQWQQSIADTTAVADECYATYGADLTYYSTTETVRDMEALRAKLGDSKLTYLGYSYGTLIGAEYASAYPDKVRALVLDGAVDPTINTVDQDKTQAAGFQLAFSHFSQACTSLGAKCPLGADPQQFVLNLMAKAAANPIPSDDASDKRRAGDGAVLLGVISALYDQTQWATLRSALVDASRGDASGILALDDQYNERSPDGTYTNIEDANAAIGCADTTDRPTIAEARQLEPQWRATDPLFGGSSASSLGFCSLWKAPPDAPITVTNSNAPPIMVIGTTGDPATPISGAEHLAALLGSGKLLVWQGDGHTAYPKTKCVTDDVDAYLINLTVPAAGATCPAS
jgi:pimeloyl-ACP methyl ester carboxylesterase